MKITSLKTQIKNSERVSVFVNDKYSFSLSLDELVKYKLKKDDELSAPEIKKFKKISTDGKLRARALEWLMNRPHSEREFRDYLYRKKAEPEQIENLVSEFTKKSYLDNAKFTAWFSELLIRRNKSNRAISSELYGKGISRELIAEVLEQAASDEEARLKIIILKKAKLSRYQKNPQKLKKYLVDQGYSYQLINETLKSFNSEIG